LSIEKQAADHGLSRQAYQKRVKNWQEMDINGEKWLVNKKHMMKLKGKLND